MTATALTTRPRLPRRTRPHGTPANWAPPGGWTRPSEAVLRAMETALARWSA
ncbi:hypothetical protein [Streptomyces sp. NBC_00078]|uniref:hypothetical protein n=1 Tax=unclassified Streptomyces TaxID=2593676 RepID=UPI002254DC6F|nr:hypothetical protein [Streptomyces sp. NBC_00078]MCX5421295.1 hypothetical protein [Streptomyces sp. NBC_00078]